MMVCGFLNGLRSKLVECLGSFGRIINDGLGKFVGEDFYFDDWCDFVVKDVVNCLQNRYVDFLFFVDFYQVFCSVIVFCYYVYFELGCFYGVFFFDYKFECVVV